MHYRSNNIPPYYENKCGIIKSYLQAHITVVAKYYVGFICKLCISILFFILYFDIYGSFKSDDVFYS